MSAATGHENVTVPFPIPHEGGPQLDCWISFILAGQQEKPWMENWTR